MDIKYMKSCVSFPFCFELGKFKKICSNINDKVLIEKPIDMCTKKGEWVSNEAQYLFNNKNEECFVKRYSVNNDHFKPLFIVDKNCKVDDSRKERKLALKKKIFYLKKHENLKFSIDKVQFWLMRSGNGFVSFEISFDIDEGDVISDELCYDVLNKLEESNDKVYCYQSIEKDKLEKFSFDFRQYVDMLLEKNNIKKNESHCYKTKKILFNYIVTGDIQNSEVNCFFRDILDPIGRKNNIREEIDPSEIYYKEKPFYYKWLATQTSITMIGDGDKNIELTQRDGIVNVIFERHLSLLLYYENISMICDKAERISHKIDDTDKLIEGEYKEQYELIYELMKSENENNKEEFIKRIFITNRDNYKRFLCKGEDNYIGGIANGDIGSNDEQLNLVYAFYYAIKKKNINNRIGKIFQNCNGIRDNRINFAKNCVRFIKELNNMATPHIEFYSDNK